MITYQLSVQYEDIESTDISNVTIKKRLSHENLTQLLEKHFLGLVNLEIKSICVKSNDTDIFTVTLENYGKLNVLTLLIAWSNKK